MASPKVSREGGGRSRFRRRDRESAAATNRSTVAERSDRPACGASLRESHPAAARWAGGRVLGGPGDPGEQHLGVARVAGGPGHAAEPAQVLVPHRAAQDVPPGAQGRPQPPDRDPEVVQGLLVAGVAHPSGPLARLGEEGQHDGARSLGGRPVEELGVEGHEPEPGILSGAAPPGGGDQLAPSPDLGPAAHLPDGPVLLRVAKRLGAAQLVEPSPVLPLGPLEQSRADRGSGQRARRVVERGAGPSPLRARRVGGPARGLEPVLDRPVPALPGERRWRRRSGPRPRRGRPRRGAPPPPRGASRAGRRRPVRRSRAGRAGRRRRPRRRGRAPPSRRPSCQRTRWTTRSSGDEPLEAEAPGEPPALAPRQVAEPGRERARVHLDPVDGLGRARLRTASAAARARRPRRAGRPERSEPASEHRPHQRLLVGGAAAHRLPGLALGEAHARPHVPVEALEEERARGREPGPDAPVEVEPQRVEGPVDLRRRSGRTGRCRAPAARSPRRCPARPGPRRRSRRRRRRAPASRRAGRRGGRRRRSAG